MFMSQNKTGRLSLQHTHTDEVDDFDFETSMTEKILAPLFFWLPFN